MNIRPELIEEICQFRVFISLINFIFVEFKDFLGGSKYEVK